MCILILLMQINETNGVSCHGVALYGYTRPGTTWAYEMNFGMNHVPRAGSISAKTMTDHRYPKLCLLLSRLMNYALIEPKLS